MIMGYFSSLYFYVCRSFSSRSKWTRRRLLCVCQTFCQINPFISFFISFFCFKHDKSLPSQTQGCGSELTYVNWEWRLLFACLFISYEYEFISCLWYWTTPWVSDILGLSEALCDGIDAKMIPGIRSGAETS